MADSSTAKVRFAHPIPGTDYGPGDVATLPHVTAARYVAAGQAAYAVTPPTPTPYEDSIAHHMRADARVHRIKDTGALVRFQTGRRVDAGTGLNLYRRDDNGTYVPVGRIDPDDVYDSALRNVGTNLRIRRHGRLVQFDGTFTSAGTLTVMTGEGMRPDVDTPMTGTGSAIAVRGTGLTITHGVGTAHGLWYTADPAPETPPGTYA